jgi:hypothetical protein
MTMRYTWDHNKNVANVRKHGVAFQDAIAIFDGFTTDELDTRYDYDEERIVATGLARGHEITVVYADRKGERRIISARPATKREREDYWRERATRT